MTNQRTKAAENFRRAYISVNENWKQAAAYTFCVGAGTYLIGGTGLKAGVIAGVSSIVLYGSYGIVRSTPHDRPEP